MWWDVSYSSICFDIWILPCSCFKEPVISFPWNTKTVFSLTASLVYADLVEGLVQLYGLFLFLWRIALKVLIISPCPQPQWLSAAFRICLGSTYAAPSETWPTRTLTGRGWCNEFPRSANAGAADGAASTHTFLSATSWSPKWWRARRRSTPRKSTRKWRRRRKETLATLKSSSKWTCWGTK